MARNYSGITSPLPRLHSMGRHVPRRPLYLVTVVGYAALVAACGGSSTPVVAPATTSDRCDVAVTASTAAGGSSGGAGYANVYTARDRQWTRTPGASWLSIPSGASGQGPSSVPFTAATNPLASVRRGTIAVNGQRGEITQAA